MSDEIRDPSSEERRLEEALAEYLLAEEQGRPPGRDTFLDHYPDLADRLRAFLDNKKRLEGIAGTRDLTTPPPGGDTNPTDAPQGGWTHAALRPGDLFGDYEILAELGQGGMGVVYKARQRSLQRLVALKVIRADRLAGLSETEIAQWISRFQAEAETLAALDHPDLVSLWEASVHEGQPYFSMKLIEGGNLATEIAAQGQGPGVKKEDQRWAAALMVQVARAVHHAHQHGVLHRDLKPGNILLDREGRPLVTDFGLAKRLNQAGGSMPSGIVGTAAYMAPEQAAARKGVSTAADVYGLGAILYEVLTGQPPFRGENDFQTLMMVLEQEPQPPSRLNASLHADLEVICLKCLRKEPGQRYASAAALADDLENWLEGRPINARPVGRLERFRSWCRRNPVPTFAAATVLAVAILAFVLIADSRNRAVALAEDNGNLAQANGKLAVDKTQLAESNGRLAVEKEKEARRAQREATLLAIHQGLDLCEQRGEIHRGLPLLAYGLELAERAEDPDLQRVIRINLAAWGRYITPQRAILPHDSGWPRVHEVVFSPSGQIVATACDDGAVRLWDVATGRALGKPLGTPCPAPSDPAFNRGEHHASELGIITLARDHDPVCCLSFSPDGKVLASATMRGWVRLWDPATGRLLTSLQHHDWSQAEAYNQHGKIYSRSGVEKVSFSPDGKVLLTAGRDGAVRLWDTASGQLRATLPHRGSVNAAAFSPDGKTILTGCGEPGRRGAARLWDVATGQQRGAPLEHEGVVWSVAFSPDGRRVLSGGGRGRDGLKGQTQLWDAASGARVGPGLQPNAAVRAVAFSPDGQRFLSAASDGSIEVVDLASGKGFGVLHPSPSVPQTGRSTGSGAISAAAFSPDGRTFVTAGNGAQAWDAVTGERTGKSLLHDGEITSVAFSPDGRSLATAGVDTTARLWESPTAQPPSGRTIQFDLPITRVAFSPNGKKLLVAQVDGSVSLHEAASGQSLLHLRTHHSIILAAAFSPDNTKLLTGSFDQTARLWDVATGRPIGEPWHHSQRIMDVAISPDGQTAAIAGDGVGIPRGDGKGTVWLWDVASGQPKGTLPHDGKVWSLAFSPDSKMLLTGSADQAARLWDAATASLKGQPLRHQGAVRAVAFSPDGKAILTGSLDGTVRLWDAASGQPLSKPLRHRAEVVAVTFSPNGRLALSASADATARLWQVPTGKPAAPALVHRGPVQAIAFSPDSQLVATGSEDGTTRLWDAASGQPVMVAHQGRRVASVAFRPDGKVLATDGGGLDSSRGGDTRHSRVIYLYEVPAPLSGTSEQVALWTRVHTGFQLDRDRAIRRLEPAAWQTARAALRGPELLPVDDVITWHRREAEECELTGHWFCALWHLERLRQREPEKAELLLRSGHVHAQLGNWSQVVDLLSQAIDRGADGWQARRQRGLAHARLGHWARAEKDLRETVRLRPEDWSLWQELGAFRAERGQWPAAAEALAEAVKRPDAPAPVHAQYALVCLWRRDGRQYEEACAALVRHLGQLRHDGESIAEAATATWALSLAPSPASNPAQILRLTEQVLNEHAMENYPFVRALGAGLFRAGRVEEALQVFNRARALNQHSPSVLLYLAMAHQRLGKREEARQVLAEASTWIAQSRRKRDQPLGGATAAGLGTQPWCCAAALLGGDAFNESSAAVQGMRAWDDLAWNERLALLHLFQEAETRVLGSRAYQAILVKELEVLRLQPDNATSHYNVGVAYRRKGDPESAVAAFRKAVRFNPKFAQAYRALGTTLENRESLDEAVAAYREAIRLQPREAYFHYLLGHALDARGSRAQAIAAYREAVRLNPDFAEAHCNLGLDLFRQGEFAQALPLLRRGDQLGSRVKDWPYPSAGWVSACERMVKLEGQLEPVLRGEIKLTDAERFDLAGLLHYKGRYAEAARSWQETLVARPEWARNLNAQLRFNAACAAALAGCGQGKNPPADKPARERWRKQALLWLEADLKLWAEQLKASPSEARGQALGTLRHWRRHPDLAGLRDESALAKLPENEQQAWRRLWAEVDQLVGLPRERP
jgi:eukaryotic-like serine/threonine-protein kinase